MIRDSIKPYPKEPEGRIPYQKCDTLSHRKCGPYISVQWGQDYPEGVFFPNATAGCVNVAIAQILSYYKYPTQIKLTYPNADSYIIELDWNNMKTHVKSGSSRKLNRSPQYNKALSDIAHLCRQISVYTKSIFEPQSTNYNYNLDNYIYPFYQESEHKTSSTIYNAYDAFVSLGYSTSNIQKYTSECTCEPLDRNNIIFMQGVPEGDNIGHAWVIDGYTKYVIRKEGYELLEYSKRTINVIYNHINWGWTGTCNGYFLDDVFNTNLGYKYDNRALHYKYDFCNNKLYFSVNK